MNTRLPFAPRPLTRSLALVALACLHAAPSARAAEPAEITLTVTVQDAQGNPLADVPLDVGTYTDRKFVQTNASGYVTTIINIAEADGHVSARVWEGKYYDMTPEERIAHQNRYYETVRGYALHYRYAKPLQPGQTEYTIDIIAHDAVTMSAQLTDGGEFWPSVWANVRGGAWGDYFPAGVPFVARGVRKGESAQVFLSTKNQQFHVVDLTAAQTTDDVDLGVLHLNVAPGESELHLTVNNHVGLWGPPSFSLQGYVTLIRDDGQVVYGYRLHPTEHWAYDKVIATGDPEAPTPLALRPTIAAGTYYLAPGVFGHPLALRVYDHVRAGNIALLEGVGVPKITVIADQQTTATFDAAATATLLLILPEP